MIEEGSIIRVVDKQGRNGIGYAVVIDAGVGGYAFVNVRHLGISKLAQFRHISDPELVCELHDDELPDEVLRAVTKWRILEC